MHPVIKVLFAAALIATLSTLFVSSILYLPPRELELLRKADTIHSGLHIPTVARDAKPHPAANPLVTRTHPHSASPSIPVDASHLKAPIAPEPISIDKPIKLAGRSSEVLKKVPPSKESRAIARAIADAMLRLTERRAPAKLSASERDDDDSENEEDDTLDGEQDDTDDSATSERDSVHTVQTAMDDPALESAMTKLAKSTRENDLNHIQRVIHSSNTAAKIEDPPSNIVGSNDNINMETDSEDHDDDQDHSDPDGSAMRLAMIHLAEQRRKTLDAQKRKGQSVKIIQNPATNNVPVDAKQISGKSISEKESYLKNGPNLLSAKDRHRSESPTKDRKSDEVQSKADVAKPVQNEKADTQETRSAGNSNVHSLTMEDAMSKLSEKVAGRTQSGLLNNKIGNERIGKQTEANNGNSTNENTMDDIVRNLEERQHQSPDANATAKSKMEDKHSAADAMAEAMEHLGKQYRATAPKASNTKREK